MDPPACRTAGAPPVRKEIHAQRVEVSAVGLELGHGRDIAVPLVRARVLPIVGPSGVLLVLSSGKIPRWIWLARLVVRAAVALGTIPHLGLGRLGVVLGVRRNRLSEGLAGILFDNLLRDTLVVLELFAARLAKFPIRALATTIVGAALNGGPNCVLPATTADSIEVEPVQLLAVQ